MSKKTKMLVYPLAACVPMTATFLMCFLRWKLGWLYSVSYAAFIGGMGLMISRTLLHIFEGDNSLKTWCVNVSGLGACMTFFAVVQSETWGMFKVEVCATAFLALYCIGERFLPDKNCDGIPDIFQSKEKVKRETSANFLYENMLFKLKGDVLGGEPDSTRPLCINNSHVYTVKQAMEEGYDELAKAGMEYIDDLIRKEGNEK